MKLLHFGNRGDSLSVIATSGESNGPHLTGTFGFVRVIRLGLGV